MKTKTLLIIFVFILQLNALAQPIGTINAFGGQKDKLPAGWLICDGTVYDRVQQPQYNALFQVIGTSWGGNGASKFAVPDLRGLFLRGLSDTSGVDPEAGDRPNSRPDLPTPGSGRNTVGSKQGDALGKHTHQWLSGSGWVDPSANHSANGGHQYARNDAGFEKASVSTEDGGKETRPKNACVLYIIKYQ
jgi:microcystin-dependent protein